MKKSINIWSFPGDLPLAEKMRIAKDAGFAGIELEMADEGPVSLTSTEADLRSVADMAASAGLAISSLATGLFWGNCGTSDNAATRAKAKEIAEKMISAAPLLGTDAILLIPGAVEVFFMPDSEVIPYDVAYDRALELVKSLVPSAEKHGVHIGIENVWNKMFMSPLELAGFIDAAGSPWVGSYFDVGNVVKFGYPEQWVRILGKRIKRVHFKDYRIDAGFPQGFVDLLAGDVNWPEVMKAFREVGYDGWVAPEMIPPYKHCATQIIYNSSAAVDAILGL